MLNVSFNLYSEEEKYRKMKIIKKENHRGDDGRKSSVILACHVLCNHIWVEHSAGAWLLTAGRALKGENGLLLGS